MFLVSNDKGYCVYSAYAYHTLVISVSVYIGLIDIIISESQVN